MTQSSLAYKGQVTIKTMHGKKVVKTTTIKNAGCLPLFSFLVDCLSGTFNKDNAPAYLSLFYVATTPVTSDPLTPGTATAVSLLPIAVSDIQTSTDATNLSASVSYTFLVPGSLISEDNTANVLGLYSTRNRNNKNKPMAWIELESGLESSSVASGVNYVVIWTLTVMNQNN